MIRWACFITAALMVWFCASLLQATYPYLHAATGVYTP
jgi:hypothetical protein